PQAPITVSENQQISLLALDAAKRLVPTSLAQPDSAPAAFAIARFIYSDTVMGAAADGRLIDTGLDALDARPATTLRVQRGWGVVELLGGWVVPVVRAFGLLATDPMVAAALWAAAATCALLLWWMRPRPARVVRRNRHVGILAF
ncbi:MAG: hypothetical protein AAB113_04580, partial [Candidatus Eisenbacteria bacterium]